MAAAAGEVFWLKSELFEPRPGEDAETNPGRYGKALAEWISTALNARGVDVEGVIPEDWGWCVMVAREPFRLWIGCGNVEQDPMAGELTWHCFVEAEAPLRRFWEKWSRAAAMQTETARLGSLLADAFAIEPRIRMVAEP
jgi:hypothetical protein